MCVLIINQKTHKNKISKRKNINKNAIGLLYKIAKILQLGKLIAKKSYLSR